MTNDPNTTDIQYDTLTPVCHPCGHTGPTVLLAAPEGRIRATAAGAQHVADHHRAASRTEEAFEPIAFVIAVPTGRRRALHAVPPRPSGPPSPPCWAPLIRSRAGEG